MDGTQLDSQQTPRPLLVTARSRSSTLAGPCSEPLVRICLLVPAFLKLNHHGKGLTPEWMSGSGWLSMGFWQHLNALDSHTRSAS